MTNVPIIFPSHFADGAYPNRTTVDEGKKRGRADKIIDDMKLIVSTINIKV